MKVLLFAQCREAAGADHCDLPVAQPLASDSFWNLLLDACPALAPFRKTARLARNGTYLQAGEMLHPGDEVALIPPVSGG